MNSKYGDKEKGRHLGGKKGGTTINLKNIGESCLERNEFHFVHEKPQVPWTLHGHVS